jgi:hypothetical protein
MKKATRTINRDFVSMPAKPKKAPVALHEPDKFDERPGAGTAFAERLIARFVPSKGGAMPMPPKRRSA